MNEIVVISGKGGTGKTSITAALAATGPKKVLADCDVDAADLHLILSPEIRHTEEFWSGEIAEIIPDLCTSCGTCLEKCRFDAVMPGEDAYLISEEHCEGCGLCEFVCPVEAIKMNPRMCGFLYTSDTRFGPMAHAALGIGEENSGKLVTSVRNLSQSLADKNGIEVVLTDGPPGIGCPVIASLTNADAALIVTEPSTAAIHDLKRVYSLTKHFGINAMAFINKTDINPDLTEEIHTFCRELHIPVVGTFGYNQDVTKAQLKSLSIVEYDIQQYTQYFEDIWDRLIAAAQAESQAA